MACSEAQIANLLLVPLPRLGHADLRQLLHVSANKQRGNSLVILPPCRAPYRRHMNNTKETTRLEQEVYTRRCIPVMLAAANCKSKSRWFVLYLYENGRSDQGCIIQPVFKTRCGWAQMTSAPRWRSQRGARNCMSQRRTGTLYKVSDRYGDELFSKNRGWVLPTRPSTSELSGVGELSDHCRWSRVLGE